MDFWILLYRNMRRSQVTAALPAFILRNLNKNERLLMQLQWKKTVGTFIQRPEFYLDSLLRLSFNSCFSEGSIVFNAQLKIVAQRKFKILTGN